RSGLSRKCFCCAGYGPRSARECFEPGLSCRAGCDSNLCHRADRVEPGRGYSVRVARPTHTIRLSMSTLANRVGSKVLPGEVPLAVNLRPRGGALHSLGHFIQHKPLGALGGFLILVFVFTAVFADRLAPYMYDQDVGKEKGNIYLQPPSPSFILGTDNLGRDMFSRIVWGSRISVAVGFGAVLVGTGL